MEIKGWNKRPVSMMVLAWLYIAVGTIGFDYHFHELLALQYDGALA